MNYDDFEETVMMNGLDPSSLGQTNEDGVWTDPIPLPGDENFPFPGTDGEDDDDLPADPEDTPSGQDLPGGMPTGWPGAVPVHADRWDTTTDPATYRVAPGDTLSGLATTYLGEPQRWREIWDMQTPEYKSKRSPDVIFAGDVLRMPPEATENFKRWRAQGSPSNQKPGELPPPAPFEKGSTSRTLLWVAGGAAIAVGLWYVLDS